MLKGHGQSQAASGGEPLVSAGRESAVAPVDREPELPDRAMPSVIAYALTNAFEVIYYIDAANGRYVVFSTRGKYEDLQIERYGSDFFEDTQKNISRVVYAQDRRRVSAAMERDALLTRLVGDKSFSMSYRLMIDGVPVFYNLLAVRVLDGDDHHIVIGVSNAADQIRRADEAAGGRDKSREFFAIAQALSSDFESIYYVNVNTDEYTEFTAQGAYEELRLELSGTDFFEECQKNLLTVVYPEDQALISSVMGKQVLLEALRTNQVFHVVYRLMIGGDPVYYRLKAVMDEDREHVVIGVSNVDAQMKRELELNVAKNQSNTFSRIAKALSKDYYSIYLVNIETDEFIEYASNQDYQDLHVENNGVDFFNDCRRNILRLVYEDDLEKALAIWDKSRLLSELEHGRTFSATYRLMMDGTPVYINCKVNRMDDEHDKKYIVIGISNVDAQVRGEQELAAIRDKANRDALTGVKSKHAYMDDVERINLDIGDKTNPPFAVVVCDVNGLKVVNDKQGHQAGDKLIKDACHIICNVFKHSPVYRTGGDEFVAILRGQDYERQDDLMTEMREINERHMATGEVVIACGSSKWGDGGDDGFDAVFERADAEMYENKSWLKTGRV